MSVTPAAGLATARRIVIKAGSSLLLGDGSDGAARTFCDRLAQDVAHLRGRGAEVVIVSSGAVALGRGRLGGR